ncbi:hypothetical protein ABZ567_04135 [Streptomyces sp. NPDC016459]|uniref:hypothetical protein n=1 Tax=Streptomyces sp. NPDC016459 TaxID=3157190 RepID=UPI0033D8935A
MAEIPEFVQKVIDGEAEPTPGRPPFPPGQNSMGGMRYLNRWFVPNGTQDVYDEPVQSGPPLMTSQIA